MSDREILEELWWIGVERVQGYECVSRALGAKSDFVPTKIAAVGKAASAMMRAAIDRFGADLPCLVVTKYDHLEAELSNAKNLEAIEAAHPVPDENSLRGGASLLEFVKTSKPDDRLLLLVSGGASSLAECLPAGVTLSDLQALNESMLADGLDIHAINKKRKEISLIKGGKLLQQFTGMQATVLLISDVENDEIGVIGSGVGAVTAAGNTHDFEAEIIASNYIARDAIEMGGETLDLDIIVNSENLYGDVFQTAKQCAETVTYGAPGLYVFGGEPTTVLPENPGEGGRNQALAAAMARELDGVKGVSILVAGTDGSDGPTGSAGGFVTGESWGQTNGGAAALEGANTGAWLREAGGLFVTGPTGTNVMDIMLVLKR